MGGGDRSQDVSGDQQRRGHVDSLGAEPLLQGETVDERRRHYEPRTVPAGVDRHGERAAPDAPQHGDPPLDQGLLLVGDELAREDPQDDGCGAGVVASEERPPAELPQDREASAQNRPPRRQRQGEAKLGSGGLGWHPRSFGHLL